MTGNHLIKFAIKKRRGQPQQWTVVGRRQIGGNALGATSRISLRQPTARLSRCTRRLLRITSAFRPSRPASSILCIRTQVVLVTIRNKTEQHQKSETRHRASTYGVSTSMYSLTFRVRNATRAPIANPPNSAQLGGIPYHSPSYIRVRAIVWACDRGQTDRQTHRRA